MHPIRAAASNFRSALRRKQTEYPRSSLHADKLMTRYGCVTVQYGERLASPDKLRLAVKGAGYRVDATNAAHSHQFKVGYCG